MVRHFVFFIQNGSELCLELRFGERCVILCELLATFSVVSKWMGEMTLTTEPFRASEGIFQNIYFRAYTF